MGALFCSYYINNRISRIRKAIITSEPNQLKQELDSNKELENFLNFPIDNNGNTPLILSIESRQLKSFEYLLNELKVDPNKPNEFSLYTPLHFLCLAIPCLDKKNSNQSTKSDFSTCSNNKNLMEDSFNDRILLTKQSKKKKIYTSVDSAIYSLGDQSEKAQSNLNLVYNSYVRINQKPIDKESLVKMFELLIQKGADLNALAKINRLTKMPGFEQIKFVCPLHIAVYNQNLTAINLLLNHGCNVNQIDPISKLNALHMACYLSKIEIVSILLQDKSIDIEAKSRNGFNCLHWLAISDNDENSFGIAMLLIANFIKKYESIYSNKTNELFLSSFDQKVKLFVNQTSNEYLQTPLMLACMKNKLNLIKILLDYEAIVDLKDKNGQTALDFGKTNESCIFLLTSFNKVKKITMKKKIKRLTIKNANENNKNPTNSENLDMSNIENINESYSSGVSSDDKMSLSSDELNK